MVLHVPQICPELRFPICVCTVPGIVLFCVSLPMSVDRVEVQVVPVLNASFLASLLVAIILGMDSLDLMDLGALLELRICLISYLHYFKPKKRERYNCWYKVFMFKLDISHVFPRWMLGFQHCQFLVGRIWYESEKNQLYFDMCIRINGRMQDFFFSLYLTILPFSKELICGSRFL